MQIIKENNRILFMTDNNINEERLIKVVILEIANRTYVEEQNELQRTILSKYNKRVRPVLNISEPLDVAVHVYIMHVSVNQLEQTITFNGHIYMVCCIDDCPNYQ